jgi:hypothetical protein
VKPAVLAALEQVKARATDSMLRPERVVEAARNPKSPLHSSFEWDNRKAATAYRLEQARTLISAAVTMMPSLGEPVRAYVSLEPDRMNGGGYRHTSDVLDSAALRRILLADALREVETLARRYVMLHELAPIFTLAATLKAKLVEQAATQPAA